MDVNPECSSEPDESSPVQYRTIWISDVHLGLRESKAEFLMDFLEKTNAHTYYLIGDIIDGWALKRSWYWPSTHNDIVQCLLDIASTSDVVYIPGNHDEAARAFPGIRLGGIHLQKEATHTTADGRRFLLLHGDEFDGVIRHARWLSRIGAVAYTGILKLNRYVNRGRRWLGMPYWSLSSYLKRRTKKAVQFIADFEDAVARRARIENVDGVVCGHIHHPEMRMVHGVQYINTGDWVESCTALVEHMDGRMELLRWLPEGRGSTEPIAAAPARSAQAPADGYALRGDGHEASPEPVVTPSIRSGDGQAGHVPARPEQETEIES